MATVSEGATASGISVDSTAVSVECVSNLERRLVTTTVTVAGVITVASSGRFSAGAATCTAIVRDGSGSTGFRCRVFFPNVRVGVDAVFGLETMAVSVVMSVKLFFM